MFRFWRCLVGYNNCATYGQVLKAYFSGKSKKTNTNLTNFFIFEILSLKEHQLFKSHYDEHIRHSSLFLSEHAIFNCSIKSSFELICLSATESFSSGTSFLTTFLGDAPFTPFLPLTFSLNSMAFRFLALSLVLSTVNLIGSAAGLVLK
ncbi:hypothetical protein BpHYR1_023802 [Brachionus plicatilis]|uniref:Uncharacterized protein n=1 Tax=Brachionus plicatilis TaxID=10195 RepID=A0A3M7PDE7_BRAPC|nr:hypothetical protein BpHYR1_023802 [Brachionus plicatilis]